MSKRLEQLDVDKDGIGKQCVMSTF